MAQNQTFRASLNIQEWITLHWPHIWEPKHYQDNPATEAKYSGRLVIHQSKMELVNKIQEIENSLIGQRWPTGMNNPAFHRALQWGPSAYPDDVELAECWIINASNKNPIVVSEAIQATRDVMIINAERGRQFIYPGCLVMASVAFYTYQASQTNVGIGCALNGILIDPNMKGRPVAGGVSPRAAFGGVDAAFEEASSPIPAPAAAQDPSAQYPSQAPIPPGGYPPAQGYPQQPVQQQPMQQQPVQQQPMQQQPVQQQPMQQQPVQQQPMQQQPVQQQPMQQQPMQQQPVQQQPIPQQPMQQQPVQQQPIPQQPMQQQPVQQQPVPPDQPY